MYSDIEVTLIDTGNRIHCMHNHRRIEIFHLNVATKKSKQRNKLLDGAFVTNNTKMERECENNLFYLTLEHRYQTSR